MIKLSKLTDYAVVIMAVMAKEPGAVLPASVIAARTSLPEPTVSKVLKLLVRGGVIASTRGISGGYSLRDKPEKIRVSDIIAAMEGPIALTSCVSDSHETCAIETHCMLRGRWNVVNSAIRTALENVTLADMMPACGRRAATQGEEARL